MLPAAVWFLAMGVMLNSPSSAARTPLWRSTAHERATSRSDEDFIWGEDPVRGVNIGGWLVMEPWITPSIFEDKPDWVVDEWTYGQYMAGQNNTYGEIRQHWNTFIGFDELESIAAVGLNTIRVQIGFWSLIPLVNGEPYLVGAYDYLKLAVAWAQTLNLKVMLDLHGVPGSQNGFDNSGLRGTRQWFWNATNAVRSIAALEVLTTEFTQASYDNTVLTIELVNEPFPFTVSELTYLETFYQNAYTAIRAAQVSQSQLVVALDEAFRGLPTWYSFMNEPTYHNVAIDTHIYSMFDLTLLALGEDQNLQWTCSWVDQLRQSNQRHWTIVGEFTPANTDCAKWLNGRGSGARFDNSFNGSEPLKFPGDCSAKTGANPARFSPNYIDHLARSFEAQTWVYEQASGWIMWTWKTEEAADWSMQTGITQGWIPTPITAKPHGAPCNSNSGATGAVNRSTRKVSRHWGHQAPVLAVVALIYNILYT